MNQSETSTPRGVTDRIGRMSRWSAAWPHAAAALWLALIATGLTAPLWRGVPSIVGDGLGDNASFVWNFWWAKQALADPARSVFSTDVLFAPLGTSLVLHTGTPLLTILSTTFLPHLAPASAYNFWIWLGLFLNGYCTYIAAHQLTRRSDAAILAGTIFAIAPFLVVRAHGHLNVLNAWGIPLSAVLSERLNRRPTMSRAAVMGVALGATALVDYYYFIYSLLLVGLLYATWHSNIQVTTTPMSPLRRQVVTIAAATMILASVAALLIVISGGTEIPVASKRIRLYGTFNFRVVIGYLAGLAALAWFGPRIRAIRRTRELAEPDDPTDAAAPAGNRPGVRHFLMAGAVMLLVIAPLVVGAMKVLMSGDYVAPKRFWRSAPPGLDVMTLVLGNPTGLLWTSYSNRLYERFAIDGIESIGWLGVVPIVLSIVGVRRRKECHEIRRWLLVLIVFGVWSLGPYLTVLGTNTGIMLPQTALRFVPVLNNARIPGRAFAVVILAVALLAAFVVTHLRNAFGRRWIAPFVLTVLTLADLWPRPFSTTRLDHSSIYDVLAAAPKGVVLELPIGLRDGFGERGRLDHWSLYYQTLHGQPIVGGFVARLSKRIVEEYERDAVLAPLLALSEGHAHEDPGALASPAESLACSIRYVVIPAGLDGETLAFVQSVFELQPKARASARVLYAVKGIRAPYCPVPNAQDSKTRLPSLLQVQ